MGCYDAAMDELTPQQILDQLDRYIIGQAAAKRAVAVAIRNRWRRQQLDPEMAREIHPRNIVMIGPTGVGKTEIARRLATLTGAPFVKVEASKFTEVGYHGRDVESMIRDLLEQAISMVREEEAENVKERARDAVLDRIVARLFPSQPEEPDPGDAPSGSGYITTDESAERRARTRDRLREQVESGALDDREIELTITQNYQTQVMFANMGLDQMDPDMANMFEKIMPGQSKQRRVTVAEAKELLLEEETDKLLDRDKITGMAIERTEQSGMIFLDEIDKVAVGSGGEGGKGGPDISRQGVQRDLLPIVEGSAVNTKHGIVHTDHILFIAAGAFHSASVSDLMPELQGRFPIRVELDSLGREQFVRILTEPDNALTKQQQQLLSVEGLEITYDDGAIEAMAELAADANARMENIGARRLMTIIENIFSEIDFDAPQRAARGETKIAITADFVNERVAPVLEDEQLSKFVL